MGSRGEAPREAERRGRGAGPRGRLDVWGLGPPVPSFWRWGPGSGRGLVRGCRAHRNLALTRTAAKEEEAKDNREKGHGVPLRRWDGVRPKDPRYIPLAHQLQRASPSLPYRESLGSEAPGSCPGLGKSRPRGAAPGKVPWDHRCVQPAAGLIPRWARSLPTPRAAVPAGRGPRSHIIYLRPSWPRSGEED